MKVNYRNSVQRCRGNFPVCEGESNVPESSRTLQLASGREEGTKSREGFSNLLPPLPSSHFTSAHRRINTPAHTSSLRAGRRFGGLGKVLIAVCSPWSAVESALATVMAVPAWLTHFWWAETKGDLLMKRGRKRPIQPQPSRSQCASLVTKRYQDLSQTGHHDDVLNYTHMGEYENI